MVRIDFNRLRFLVIDDNAHMRRILRTLLHGFGTREVYEAEDGATGLEAFTHYMPDIILVDWVMPIFDGLELTQMIRQPGANANPYVPIIMLSGHSEKKRIVTARDAGVTEFLAKPISAKALYERIGGVLAVADLARHRQAVEMRHLLVEEDDVRLELADIVDDLARIGADLGLPDREPAEHGLQQLPHEAAVFNHQDADFA